MDDFGKNCPKCGTLWTKVPKLIGGEFWYICKPCNGRRAEDLIKESKTDQDDFGYWNPTTNPQLDIFDDWSDYCDNWLDGSD